MIKHNFWHVSNTQYMLLLLLFSLLSSNHNYSLYIWTLSVFQLKNNCAAWSHIYIMQFYIQFKELIEYRYYSHKFLNIHQFIIYMMQNIYSGREVYFSITVSETSDTCLIWTVVLGVIKLPFEMNYQQVILPPYFKDTILQRHNIN